jgi:hypothetical protein
MIVSETSASDDRSEVNQELAKFIVADESSTGCVSLAMSLCLADELCREIVPIFFFCFKDFSRIRMFPQNSDTKNPF